MTERKNGFRVLYSVEQIDGKGMGVVAREAIEKACIVWRHVPGRYVVYDEQTFKAAIGKMSSAEVVYELTHVFGLADFPGCLIRVLDDGVLINHSSDDNLATNNSTATKTSFDASSPQYLNRVTEALLADRYALVATRDIETGEEFTNDYSVEFVPPYYDVLYEQYGVSEDFLSY